ncbi:hypothetical protein JTB14_006189 [Gonioctena quinquepunctata]|nr:hypothetical protein JTB14_006189 [Gonioctena quinquepunctata]
MGVEGEYYEGHCKLLELPHYVLSTLFSYVDATSLFHLSQTCNYLKEFIDDPSFWRYIDARDDPNTCSKLHYCTNRTHERTTHLLLHGNLNLLDLPSFFFDKIKPFQNLRVLALENLKLQGSKVALKDFPAGLEELSLRRTYVKNSTYFFQHSVRNLSKLRVLILDECCWVTCSFLLSVSKYEHLEIISIVKCLRVHLNMIPYLNVAKFGCKKLKVFDCRFTGIGGELLRTFYSKESLQRLYFQSFKSAEVDYDEKIIDNSGTGSRKNSNSDPNTAISIADIHLYEYNSTTAKASSEVEKVFDSLLYEDPYPECTCGSVESNEDKLYADLEFFDDDMVHIPSGRGEPKFVCNKHMKDIVNLPSSFRDFFLSQQRQFNPASEAHFDTDSNSDDDEDGCCCYFGMGSSMIIPITHDRTPSRGEEMTLPREGARNQTSRVFILNPMESRNDDGNNTFQNSRISPSKSTKRNSSNAIKRRRAHSQSDSDSDPEHSKKSKKEESSDLDGLSNEAQALLVNQLVESADEVKNRIERLMGENGMGSGIQRRISSDNNAVNVNIYPQETKSLD